MHEECDRFCVGIAKPLWMSQNRWEFVANSIAVCLYRQRHVLGASDGNLVGMNKVSYDMLLHK